jgi:tRNA A-37 threonylcarbamoyl transferase component Bud32
MTQPLRDLRAALADRYDLQDLIGRGGMATVYRALDRKHGRTVAVKVLRPDLGELIGPERFVREIEIAARLMHPNILQLYDSGEAAGALYYVMPYVDGESLRGLLNRVRLVDMDGAVEIANRVASALDYAHAQGILHRDIKPENILLPGGQAVLADFGIAKAVSSATEVGNLTRTGIALGTPGYMSPEQAAGVLELNRATDVYSLGVVAHEMLVGGLPRSWITPDVLAAGHFSDAAPDHRALLDRLPPGIERALVRALALRPEERFATAGEFASSLARPETVAVPVRRPPDAYSVATASEPTPRRLAAAGQTAPVVPYPTPTFLGAPTRVVVERVVPGTLAADDFTYLVEEIRAAIGRVGYPATTDQSLLWTSRRPKKPISSVGEWLESAQGNDGPDILVRVFSRHGQTRIHLEQRLGQTAGGIFGGVWGGGGGSIAAVILGVGLPLGAAPLLVIPAAVGAIAGGYGLSRAIYRAVVGNKARTLEDLADRLVEVSTEIAG